jgi:hypothetical protein
VVALHAMNTTGLSPGNIMQSVMCDASPTFGISVLCTSTPPSRDATHMACNLDYAAPEQIISVHG